MFDADRQGALTMAILADLGLGRRLPVGESEFKDPDAHAGTLAYMAREVRIGFDNACKVCTALSSQVKHVRIGFLQDIVLISAD